MAFKEVFQNKYVRFFLLLAIILFFGYLVSDFLGFSAEGFDDPQVISQRNFYVNTGLYSAIILVILFFFSIISTKGDATYGQSIGFSSQGEFPHFNGFKRFTYPQLSLIFLILFLIIGLFNFNFLPESTSYTGIGVGQEQQFTNFENAIYVLLLVPVSENLAVGALFAFIIVMLGFLSRKFRWNKNTFIVLVFLFLIIGGVIFGIGNHKLRYGGSEIALNKVGAFWGIGGLVTALTGSFIPFWFLHIINNLFFIFNDLFSSDTVNFISIVIVLLLGVVYAFVYRGRLLGETKVVMEDSL